MGTLTLFEADLTQPSGFDKAIEGCEVVIRVAAIVKQYFDKDLNLEWHSQCCGKLQEIELETNYRHILDGHDQSA